MEILSPGYVFGFADFDKDGSVYLIDLIGNKLFLETQQLLTECSSKSQIYKSKDTLPESLATDDEVWYCAPDSLSCQKLSSVGSIYKIINKPIMVERIAKVQMDYNILSFPNLEKYFSQSDVAAYLSLHEMFHIYQMKFFKDFHHEYQGLATTDQCSQQVQGWSQKLSQEIEIARAYLTSGYFPTRARAIAFVTAIAEIRNANSSDQARCLELLKRDERLEGTAHYMGNLFLEQFKSKSALQLASVDQLFLKTKDSTLNWLHGYVTGNLMMRALLVLDPSHTWEQKIEDGESPFDLALAASTAGK